MLSRVEYKNEKGSFHRLDGPAIEDNDYRSWWINGKRHREDGPAIEWYDGDKWWYLNDTRYFSEQEYQNELIKLKLERLINI